ncbi:MAG: hypothetical protein V3R29_12145 [Candidatus Acidoferrales bacterium]
MSRAKQGVLLVGALALMAGVVYLAYRSAPPGPRPQPKAIPALGWLPAESGLVAGFDLEQLRGQAWLLALLEEAGGEVEEGAEYREFVEATGFDYRRDLDRVWLGVFGASEEPTVAGVAEGRFDRERILAYARRQGAIQTLHGGVDIYEVQTEFRPPPIPGQPPPETQVRTFALAFLEESYLAFGTDAASVARVVDCREGRAPAVASDAARRADLERLAAGRQVWLVDEREKWQPQFLREQEWLGAEVVQLSLGLQVSPDGVEAEAAARCREPAQAGRLANTLRLGAVVLSIVLRQEEDKFSQAALDALGRVELTQEESTLRAWVRLPPELLTTLLSAAPLPGN